MVLFQEKITCKCDVQCKKDKERGTYMTLQNPYAHIDALGHIQEVRLKDESLTQMVEHAGRMLELGR